MIRSNLRLKALGLCAMVLGLMAFSAGGAQAEAGAKWLVNGVDVGDLLPSIGIKELENKTSTLATKIAGAKVEYLCTEAKLIEAKLGANGSINNAAGTGFKILFHGCITVLNGVPSPACVPKTAGQPNGLILTNPLKGLILLHKNAVGALEDVVDIDPVEGLTFVTLLQNVAGGCVLPEKVPVLGHIVLKDCKNLLLEPLVEHLLEQHSLTHLYVISLTAEHAANLIGTSFAKLIGAHEGLKWAGDPA